jgi:hypothetical protein
MDYYPTDFLANGERINELIEAVTSRAYSLETGVRAKPK